jgi:hypothetical protein
MGKLNAVAEALGRSAHTLAQGHTTEPAKGLSMSLPNWWPGARHQGRARAESGVLRVIVHRGR